MTAAPPPMPPRHPDAPLDAAGSADAGMAVTTHHLATRAAVEVMRAGGNAVDAAIAANAVLGVVLPTTCGPGGDLFALIHRPGDAAPAALNASGTAGSRLTAAALRARGFDEIPLRHEASITVPGCVDGWEAMAARFGSWTLADLLGPAIALAAEGFPASRELAAALTRIQPLIGDQPSADALYPGGTPPAEGAHLVRHDLARTLVALAEGGRDAFYLGEVGTQVTAATDGAIVAEDLAAVQAEWIDPLGAEVHGLQAWTIPPNSQGYLTLAAAWIAERMAPDADPTDPATHHALIEAYRAVAWERDDLAADPGTAPMAPADLVAPDRLDSRLARLRDDRTTPWPASRTVPGGTMYLCTRDGSGMGVSLIQSNFHGIGSGKSAGATGVFLHNRGTGFTLRPGHPNELMPGRRPLHTLAPSLWTDGGELRLILGTRGGQYQPQLLLQVASHHLGSGRSLPDAQAQPRWTVDHWGPGEQHTVLIEPTAPDEVVDGLRRRGHHVETADGWQTGWGPVAAIRADAAGVVGAGDPRVSTSGAATT